MPFVERWRHKFQIKPGSWVFVPTDKAIEYGTKVKTLIEEKWFAPKYYFHLRDGGHVQALHSHIDSSYFVHLDIKNFFGCVNRSRVTRCVKEYLPYRDAREIANLSTVRLPESESKDFILPFGFVQSPILASLCLNKSKLGKVLHDLEKSISTIVSVYMDDIVVSGNDAETLTDAMKQIKLAAERSRFFLNSEKEEGPAKKVTAFNVELSNQCLELTQERVDRFIASYLETNNIHRKKGILGYVSSVNREQAKSLTMSADNS